MGKGAVVCRDTLMFNRKRPPDAGSHKPMPLLITTALRSSLHSVFIPHPPSIFRVTLLSGDKSRRQSKNHQSWPGQRGGRFWQASVFPAFTNGADLTFKRPLLLLPLPHPPLHGVQGCWKEWDQRRNISQARWISTFKPMECLCLSFSWARPFCSQCLEAGLCRRRPPWFGSGPSPRQMCHDWYWDATWVDLSNPLL